MHLPSRLLRTASASVITVALAGVLLTACASEKPQYSYSGATGPSHWGELDPAWILAKVGLQQSPIDIQDAQQMAGGAVVMHYKPTPLNIVNNGHTIQVDYAPGSTLSLDGQVFELKQFHFHAPSEHMVNGLHRTMEGHLVHTNEVGEGLIVSVLFDVGTANEFLNGFWGKLPMTVGVPEVNTSFLVDVSELLPPDRASWRYMGSLCVPPCNEGVRWVVLQTAVEASSAQVAAFTAIIGPNNRPIQQPNGRVIKSVD